MSKKKLTKKQRQELEEKFRLSRAEAESPEVQAAIDHDLLETTKKRERDSARNRSPFDPHKVLR